MNTSIIYTVLDFVVMLTNLLSYYIRIPVCSCTQNDQLVDCYPIHTLMICEWHFKIFYEPCLSHECVMNIHVRLSVLSDN